MGMHGSGWFTYLRSGDEKPKVTWDLMKRVLRYSSPYRREIFGMLVTILLTTGLLYPRDLSLNRR